MSHTAELIAVGTELLLGNICNTDAQMISQALSQLGINVFYHTVVGDNPERAKTAVEIAKKRADIIITTGGLGPTCDDLTKQVPAEAFGKQLVYHEESAQRIRSYFETYLPHRTMTENNLQQAMLPEGCTVLDNDWGTAPGCTFEADGVRVIMLPGPPRECRAMVEHRVIPLLKSLSDGVICSRTLKLFGIGESNMESQLHEQMLSMQNPTLAPYAKEGECELRITAKAPTEEEAQSMLAPVEQQLREQFGDLIYGVDIPNLETCVSRLLREQGLTLSTAESCTGGLAAKRMTDLPGASQVFKGGVVCYTNAVKHHVLGVRQETLDQYGAVSRETAAELALGACRVLGSDIAISITGVAGPDPDEGKPVGLVYCGIARGDQVWVRETRLGQARDRIRNSAVLTAFDLVRRLLTGLPVE
ncbi:MAG: competence/damage-inducible protein A [Oscillospiraceae bacterium]|nr:competence/damage-inducible protein A [Oscillospiraceae bacterium]